MDLKQVFNRFRNEEETTFQHKNYQFEIINDEHLLKDVLGNQSPVGRSVLASHITDVTVTVEIQSADTTVRDDKDLKNVSVESLDGSPMKLRHFSVTSQEWQDSTMITGSPMNRVSPQQRKSLSMIDTRRLVSQYTLFAHTRESCPPLWVLCEDSREDCVAMGVHVTTNRQDRTEIHLHNVSCTGPAIRVSTDFQKILFQHLHRSESKRVEKRCTVEYDIFESLSDATPLGAPQKLLVVEASWNKVSSLLQTPPLDAKTSVRARVAAGDMQSATYSQHSELLVLQGFAAGLKDGLISWAAEKQDDPPLPKVKSLLEELKLGDAASTRKRDDKGDVDELTSPLKTLGLVERVDLDFTDHLWNVLQECGSYQQLTECLQYVLDSLKAGQIQPRIHRRNKSQLSELVRDSYHNEMVAPPLVGVLPLQLLVEAGIEKMAADYSDTLIGKELVTASHLTYFTESDVDTAERVARLYKLHLVLELVVMLEHYLDVPRVSLGVAARNALLYYESNAADEAHTFSLFIPASTSRAIFERCQPTKWRMSLVSNLDDYSVHTECPLTTKSPFSHISHQSEPPPPPENDDCEKTSYFMTIVSESVVVM